MSRKILVGLAGLLVVALLGVAVAGATGTLAIFSDVERSTGNRFQAGTMDLKIDGGNSAVTTFQVAPVDPGDSGSGTIRLENTGTSETLYLMMICIEDVRQDDGPCVEPESHEDGTCGWGEAGELAEYLYLEFGEDTNGDGEMNGGPMAVGMLSDLPLCETSLSAGQPSDHFRNWVFQDGEAKTLVIEWSVDEGVGNVIQGDIAEFDLKFHLGGHHMNP